VRQIADLDNGSRWEEGFRISLSALTLRASVPNLDQDTFARLAQDAE
jgi:hypothetical protein